MNIRGLGAGPKFIALKHFFRTARPKIIFVQETMHSSKDSIAYFRRMFPSWFLVATGANGQSGGLAVMWDPAWVKALAFKCCAGILITVSYRGTDLKLNLLNIYGPCRNRLPFWEKLFASEILDMESLIIAGDLNMTLSADECWGSCRKTDKMGDRLRVEMMRRNLVDVVPDPLSPTWDNGRFGHAYKAKRIDRFIIHVGIIDKCGPPFSFTAKDFTSDHRPILLEWRDSAFKKGYSFKFNRVFLSDPDFNNLISSKWADLQVSNKTLFTTFREKIQALRISAKEWQTQKIKNDRRVLSSIQSELESLLSSSSWSSMSFDKKNKIRVLTMRKNDLLLKEEITWRLKSRALWLKEGDRNSKFFHSFANARRKSNSIWNIRDSGGNLLSSQEEIANEATSFFQNQYKRGHNSPHDMFWAAESVPIMFDPQAYEDFIKPVSEDVLLSAMKAFNKDRSPGPDGWPIEFFIHFFDLFKRDLLRMVEASRMSGHIHSSLSSTFIALIPKKKESATLHDFRPISLCNSLFKIISKIIAERLKPVLNQFISRDQHAFLKDRNIWDAVAMTQECLFSMATNKSEAAIYKIDLKKAFDCVDWGFLCILLAKIGLRSKGIKWVMACVENVHFSVITNGIPSSFFKAERGLRQGCPLSPLLFILVMNTLSLQINRAVQEKEIRPIKICKDIYLSHNLFVDDILIFAMLCKKSWTCIHIILKKFQSASGILINRDKSKLFHNNSNADLISWTASLLRCAQEPIDNACGLLGPSFPSSNLHHKKMSSLAANFLWGGRSFQSKIHLIRMEDISRPRKDGGWGLLNLKIFGKALIYKTLHRGIFGSGPWSLLINRKYLKGKGIIFWYRRKTLGKKSGSAIWLGFRKLQQFFLENLRWKIHTGASILIGIDCILNGPSTFPPSLILYLQNKGIFSWDKLISSWSNLSPVWKSASELHLPPSLSPLWTSFEQSLSNLPIHRAAPKDVLVWALPSNPLPISVKNIYAAVSPSLSPPPMIFPMTLWKVSCPLKMVLFLWLVFYNKNLTWEVLQQRGWSGPGRCSLCLMDSESNFHLFFTCPISSFIWYDLSISFGFPHISFSFVQEAIRWWSGQSDTRRSLFTHSCWLIWKWRNSFIFQDAKRPVSALLSIVKASYL
eukprot:PITA_22290